MWNLIIGVIITYFVHNLKKVRVFLCSGLSHTVFSLPSFLWAYYFVKLHRCFSEYCCEGGEELRSWGLFQKPAEPAPFAASYPVRLSWGAAVPTWPAFLLELTFIALAERTSLKTLTLLCLASDSEILERIFRKLSGLPLCGSGSSFCFIYTLFF